MIHPRAIAEKVIFLANDYYKASKDKIIFRVYKEDYQLRAALRGDWEKVFCNLQALCQGKTLFVDVGANVGIASLLLAKHAVKVISVEPVPSTFHRLVANISENQFFNIHPFCCAASGACGFVRMTAVPSSGINRILDTVTTSGEASAANEGSTVALALKLDNLLMGCIGGQLFDHLLVKIDTERHELDTLRGALNTLSMKVKTTLCAEYFDDDNLQEIEQFLGGVGFRRMVPPHGDDHANVFFTNSFELSQ